MTAEMFKARLRAEGKPITVWAKEHDFPVLDVYRVLNGVYKAHYGRAHEIAVAAGIKPKPDSIAA